VVTASNQVIYLFNTTGTGSAICRAILLHLFNGLFSSTTWVSQHQKGKPFWILMKEKMMGWHLHLASDR